MKAMLLCCFAALAACNTLEAYPELAKGETATVYACGEWQPAQLAQIQSAIEDWNAGVTLSTGAAPYAYGGQKPEMASYDENDIGDGVHCIYQLIDDTRWSHRSNLTAYGRQLWNDYHSGSEEAAALYDNDDIVIFNEDPDMKDPALPPHSTWEIQGIVAHELGHAAGLEHQPQDSDSVMTPRVKLRLTTALDHASFCGANACL